MNYPLRNLIYEKIKQAGNMTDSELIKNLSKDGVQITPAELDKTLLALEIFGLIRVFWVAKDRRRLEAVLAGHNHD
jgi:hypothetical protein